MDSLCAEFSRHRLSLPWAVQAFPIAVQEKSDVGGVAGGVHFSFCVHLVSG